MKKIVMLGIFILLLAITICAINFIFNNSTLFSNEASLKRLNVAVIDTGIDVEQKIFKNINIKKYFLNKNDNSNEHGTLVTGIIVRNSIRNFNKAAFMDNVIIHSIDIGDNKNMNINNLISAIDKAIKLNVDIINISLGTYADNKDLREIVKLATERDIIIVCASGDDATNQYLYPASYDGTISVSSVDKNDVHLLFNNANDRIIVCALGENINTGIINAKDKKPILINGTSAATAIITSLIINLKIKIPNLNREQLMQAIKNTSVDLGEKGKDVVYGYGRMNYIKIMEFLNGLIQ